MGKKDRYNQEAIDKGEFGKVLPHDPNFNGPLHNRSCTDVICLLLFFAFIVAWAVVGSLAFSYGDPARLISPVDSDGNHCGVDANVADKPYLFYFDVTKCLMPSVTNPFSICNTPQICVDECPKEVFLYNISPSEEEDIRKKIKCKYFVHTDEMTLGNLSNSVQDGNCAKWYSPSTNVGGHCVPLVITEEMINNIQNLTNLVDLQEKLNNGSKVIQLISQAKEVVESIVLDLDRSWPYIAGGLVLAMFLSLIYIILMRWFAGIMVWVSLFGVTGLLAYCVYASYTKYSEMGDEVDKNTDYGDGVVGQVKSVLALRDTWLGFLIVSSILLVIVLLLILFLRKRIRIAVALVGEASRAVGSITSTLGFPLIPWLLQIGVIAWAVTVALYLAASAKPSYMITGSDECICNGTEFVVGEQCTPPNFQSQCNLSCNNTFCAKIGSEVDGYIGYLHAFNIFGFFWGLFFMSAFGEMVLAGTFATWYWTFNKSDVPFFTLTHSLVRTMRYHLGTLAFGSLILAICRMIRVILEYINGKLKKYDNAFVKAIMCCLRCFFWCLEKFIRFINRNAYIMCAIHGKNFCKSARDAFNLLMRNIIRVFVLDKVTDFLLFLGRLMITAATVALSFYFFSDKLQVDQIPEIENAVPQLNYYFVPIIVIGIGTYFITSIFFGVYAMAVDTLFLCFLEDSERNDGSMEKPYFMSKRLMKILGKKNKKDKYK